MQSFGRRVRRLTGTIAVASLIATFTVQIAGVGTASAAPGISIGDTTVSEAAGVATFTVSVASPGATPITVDFLTTDGSATSDDADFEATSGRLRIPAGDDSETFTVPVLEDGRDESNETFTVTLSNLVGDPTATITDATATATITDNDVTPTVSVSSSDVLEPDATQTTSAWVTLALSATSGLDVTGTLGTGGGTASASVDYDAVSTSFTIPAGQRATLVAVPISGDGDAEADETVMVSLTGVSNATAGSPATLTIRDDETPGATPTPVATILGGRTVEADSGVTTVTFTVALSSPVAASVDYTLGGGGDTASAADRSSTGGTVTFPGTVTNSSQTFTVDVTGDLLYEIDEVFTATISSATIGVNVASAPGFIDNDDPLPVVTFNPTSTSVIEGNGPATTPVSVTAALDTVSDRAVGLSFHTADGSATTADYTAVPAGTSTIAAGATSASLAFAVVGDTSDEASESFNVLLDKVTNAVLGTAVTATVTILNDDGQPDVRISPTATTVAESGLVVLTISATSAPASNVVVTYATAEGTAAPGADFTGETGTVTLTTADFSETVDIAILADTLDEDDETFAVNLTGATGPASIDISQSVVTIADNDSPPAITAYTDEVVTEPASGTATVTFDVDLSAASGRTVTVPYTLDDGTATAGSDYQDASGTLTFVPGDTEELVVVTVYSDLLDEFNETVVLNLGLPTNGGSVTDGLATINDSAGDTPPTISVNNAIVAEGSSGTRSLTFTATLSAPSGKPVTATLGTAAGTATAGSDYNSTPTPSSLSIPAGSTTATVEVAVTGDTEGESDETLTLNITSIVNASPSSISGTGTIANDDGPNVISISNASVTEGDGGTPQVVFDVTLSSPGTLTLDYGTTTSPDGTATSGSDFTAVTGGTQSCTGTCTIAVSVLPDHLDEVDEWFYVQLGPETGWTLAGGGKAKGTIVDDEPPATFSISGPTVNETATTAQFTVTLSDPTPSPAEITVTTANGSAAAGSDYTAKTETLTFPVADFVAGSPFTKTFTVSLSDDLDFEGTETFVANLSAPTNASIATSQATATITDNESVPQITITTPVSIPEADSGTSTVNVGLSLSGPAAAPVTVRVASADGSATAGQDYVSLPPQRTVTFAPGATSASVSLTILNDDLYEGSETIALTLSMPSSNATIAVGSGTVTITNDDQAPQASVSPTSVVEGNSGTANMTFTVSLSAVSGLATQLQVNTGTTGVAPTTLATAGADYTAIPTMPATNVTIPAGGTSTTVTVPVVGDTVREGDEGFSLTISNPVGATIATATAKGTIVDDDALPTITVADVSKAEGTAVVPTAFNFTITLSPASAQTVEVKWQTTTGGTATPSTDFAPQSTPQTIQFSPGVTTRTVTVNVVGDSASEPNETFSILLSGATNATIGDNQATGTILNDDTPTITVGDVTITELDFAPVNANFILRRTGDLSGQATFSFATADGTAKAGTDYLSRLRGIGDGCTTECTFAPGESEKTVTVQVLGDTITEPAETFSLNLSNVVGATLSGGQGVATIVDNETAPAISVQDVSITEGDGGFQDMVFTVITNFGVLDKNVTVDFATIGNTAEAGKDFVSGSGTLTFAPGETAKKVNVPIRGDIFVEPTETFTFRLTNTVNGQITRGEATGTIVDNDVAPPVGYWFVASDGGLFAFGDAPFYGSAGDKSLAAPIVAMVATATSKGYYLVGADGAVFNFGDAKMLGQLAGTPLNKPIVGMAVTPTGNGYWLVASDGGLFAYGDAAFFGSTGDIVLNKPIVAMASTPSGNGYWLVASDGGLFAFGDAGFFGSTGDIVLNKPIVGMTASETGRGYLLVATDGGMFAFGDAGFFGSTGDIVLNSPVIGMQRTRSGDGYWLVAADGGVFAFGDAEFKGSTGNIVLNKPIVGMATLI